MKKTTSYEVFLWLIMLTLGQFIFGCSDFGAEYFPPQPELLIEDSEADWSPDGRWIVFRHDDYKTSDSPHPSGLYIIDTLGQDRTQIATGWAYSPAWSPDGRYIAFDGGVIVIYDTEAHLFRTLTDFGAHYPRWSPDGTRISCTRTGTQDTVGIWIVDVSSGIAGRWGFGSSHDWSPSGDELTDTGYLSGDQSALFKTPLLDPNRKRMLFNSSGSLRTPRWSPNSATIAWTVYPPREWAKVWLIDTNGTNARSVVNGKEPSWSPDSRRLIFSGLVASKDKMVLWKIDILTHDQTQLTW